MQVKQDSGENRAKTNTDLNTKTTIDIQTAAGKRGNRKKRQRKGRKDKKKSVGKIVQHVGCHIRKKLNAKEK